MTTVTIVGGGFAGMAAALFLQKHGIASTIYETRDEAYTSGGNIALAPNALRVLDHIGVYDKIRTQGYNYEEISFTNGAGTVLGHFLNGSQTKYNYQAVRIHRTIVRDALREQCKAQGIKIQYEKRCTGVIEDSNGKVTVAFTNGEPVTADFVIGADGIHSHLRSHLAPTAEAPYFSGLMGVMGHVMEDDLEGIQHGFGLPAMLFGDSGSFAIMPSSFSGDEIGYFATIEVEDRSRAEWDKLGHNKQELKKMLEDRFVGEQSKWPAYVQFLTKKTPLDSLTSWPFFYAPHLDNWVSTSSRVFLIGDSAHAIPPTGGQGAAMALEDSETLAYTLADSLTPLREGEEQESRLSSLTSKWNAHRHARVAKVLDFTTKNGTLRKSSPHFYEQAAKEWLIWAAFKWMGSEGGAQWMYQYSAESWTILKCYKAAFLDVRQCDLEVTIGLIGNFCSIGGSMGSVVFSSVFGQIYAKQVGKWIADTAVKGGASPKTIPDLMGAVSLTPVGVPDQLGTLTGVSDQMLDACVIAARHGFADGFRIIWLASIPVGVIAFFCASAVRDPSKYFTNHGEIHLNKKVGSEYEEGEGQTYLGNKVEDDISHD